MSGSGSSLLAASILSAIAAAAHGASALCPAEDTGLTLPPGFCASIFADDIGHARHLVVAPNGVVYVNTRYHRNSGNTEPPPGGFLVALKDTTGSGKADVVERFGETHASGGTGGTGIGMYNGALFAEVDDKIMRFALPAGAIVPLDLGEPVVTGLPVGGDHPMHPFAIDAAGRMYLDVASATNSCQQQNRTARSPGANPCTELKTRGGIWRYDAKRTHQAFSQAERFATGIRNAEGFGIDTVGHRLFVTQHGRDQLHANWPDLYKPEQEATLPAEELLLLTQGGDYGWPECYYDPVQAALVLAPEYGGDGGKRRGVCTRKLAPIAAFPAHWAPDGMAFYEQQQFPAHYRGGVFIAFHGSWDRAPYPQQGYNVAFQPLAGGASGGACEIFADGFAGGQKSPATALHRPTGIAVAPDGVLFVSDDVRGRIYRIEYRGAPGMEGANASNTPCPGVTAPAGPSSMPAL
jgi:glucose/arabinose dehydrogenase